jgi:hypothetical protein
VSPGWLTARFACAWQRGQVPPQAHRDERRIGKGTVWRGRRREPPSAPAALLLRDWRSVPAISLSFDEALSYGDARLSYQLMQLQQMPGTFGVDVIMRVTGGGRAAEAADWVFLAVCACMAQRFD